MPDAYTSTTALPYDQVAYDMMAYWSLRPQLIYDQIATVEPTRQCMPGTSTVFSIQNDLAAATTPLTETDDINAVALSASQVTVALAEYGNAVNSTALVRATSYVTIDNIVANAVGFNAGISVDTIIRNIVQAGTNVLYASTATSRVTVGAAMTLTAARVRQVLAQLKTANVMPQGGGFYTAIMHPDVEYDLRGETGAAAWRVPHEYSQPDEIWAGETGVFEGFRWLVNSRAPMFADAGVGGTVDVYATLFLGEQALAKTYSTQDGNREDPRVILGPVIDKLRRLVPVGWYFLGGFGRFREASLRRIESSSSIGANT